MNAVHFEQTSISPFQSNNMKLSSRLACNDTRIHIPKKRWSIKMCIDSAQLLIYSCFFSEQG